mmetsp:Transcript_9107/g.30180  ORF Transcript_9107/g.30180 Transcript_9107/m.30180 type:complete len:209 (-) Transcript_9107:336-962(-)
MASKISDLLFRAGSKDSGIFLWRRWRAIFFIHSLHRLCFRPLRLRIQRCVLVNHLGEVLARLSDLLHEEVLLKACGDGLPLPLPFLCIICFQLLWLRSWGLCARVVCRWHVSFRLHVEVCLCTLVLSLHSDNNSFWRLGLDFNECLPLLPLLRRQLDGKLCSNDDSVGNLGVVRLATFTRSCLTEHSLLDLFRYQCVSKIGCYHRQPP